MILCGFNDITTPFSSLTKSSVLIIISLSGYALLTISNLSQKIKEDSSLSYKMKFSLLHVYHLIFRTVQESL